MDKQLKDIIKKILNGETPSLKELSLLAGVSRKTIHMRIRRGWKLGDAAIDPVMSADDAGRKGKEKSYWR